MNPVLRKPPFLIPMGPYRHFVDTGFIVFSLRKIYHINSAAKNQTLIDGGIVL